MPDLPYPQHIKPLTSLRFLAAIWVLLYHFKDHLGLDLGRFGLIADGYLGVDLFFALSGFILAHVYLTEFESGKFGYGGFLRNRLARVYPMHLVALTAMLVLFAGANLLGVGENAPDSFKLTDIAAHLLLIHAWGTTETVGWNFPSWSISAEWAAYLAFPLIAAFVLKAQQASRALVACALALCLASYVLLDNLHLVAPWVGQDFSGMTAQIGALRIVPSFLLGVSLYAFGRNNAAPKAWAWPIALISAAWIIAVCSLRLWQGLVWFGLAGLLYGLAETSRHSVDAPMAGKSFVFFGAASFALYMLHLPIDIVWFHALEKLGVTEASPLAVRALAVAGVFVACTIAAAFAYLCIEEPARNFIRAFAFKPFPARRPSAAQ